MSTTLVSVDLDDLVCYHAIHGLPEPAEERHGALLEATIPRFLELFDEVGVKATFFVIGRTLERDQARGGRVAELLREVLKAGHELGNHSHAHAYDMVEWDAEAIGADVARCDELLRGLGAEVRGFRAPGYSHDAQLLTQVAALGYAYDSSLLPSPGYYVAKLGAAGLARLFGRESRTLLSRPTSFFGGTVPHYMSSSGLWEVPMSVSPTLRLPLIGTTLLAGPEPTRRLLVAQAEQLAYFHFELHAIDLADVDADGLVHLLGTQPGLGTPLGERGGHLAGLLRSRGGGTSIVNGLDF